MSEEKTIAKLKQFVEAGQKPCRRFQRYSRKKMADCVNCLFHAIFNANNKQLKGLKLDEDDKEVFKSFFKDGNGAKAIADIKNFVEKCGLLFEPCDYEDKMDAKSSKIAIFLQDDLMKTDFHLFREEVLPNGSVTWSSKMGDSKTVKRDDYLDMHMDGMSFHGCFKITNPYIVESEEKSQTMGRCKS